MTAAENRTDPLGGHDDEGAQMDPGHKTSHGHHAHGEDDWSRGARAAHAGEVVMDAEFWDGMYRSRSSAWSGQPNPQVVTEVADLAPGTALDVGCGEGADAVWLAERGWRVTGVDISTTALGRAQEHADLAGAEVAERITWVQADLVGGSAPDAGAYDLVTAQFIHLPSALRAAFHSRLAAAVAPGGTLLVVGHHPSDEHAGVGRWSLSDLGFTAAQVAEVLDPATWQVVADESRPRSVVADDGGENRTVHDVVLVARRLAAH
ncbi:MAG: class I SAM-dependent methyltransferase [Cellulomonas sp.]